LVGDRPTPVEAAFAWLFGPETADAVPARVGGQVGCPITTAAAIAVANDYGMTAHARRWQEWLASLSEAELPVDLRSVLAPNAGARLAARAVASYEAGDRGDGDWVMHRLARTKLRSGVAIVCYLKAALLQVQAAFEQSPEDLPDEIDPADGRVQAVLRWAGLLASEATLADVGCGKGRFLRHVSAAFPGMNLVGIDPSTAMLARLPAEIPSRRGSLLAIPARDGEFDAALAIESLEHALVPAHAVEELCRVVRPGGRVLVIDKHRAKQARSEHEPWERWFWPEELAAWLGRYCDEVRVEPVAHLEGRPGEDLFLAASGRRIPPDRSPGAL
jgi:SAM-dependent methyltransferase